MLGLLRLLTQPAGVIFKLLDALLKFLTTGAQLLHRHFLDIDRLGQRVRRIRLAGHQIGDIALRLGVARVVLGLSQALKNPVNDLTFLRIHLRRLPGARRALGAPALDIDLDMVTPARPRQSRAGLF